MGMNPNSVSSIDPLMTVNTCIGLLYGSMCFYRSDTWAVLRASRWSEAVCTQTFPSLCWQLEDLHCYPKTFPAYSHWFLLYPKHLRSIYSYLGVCFLGTTFTGPFQPGHLRISSFVRGHRLSLGELPGRTRWELHCPWWISLRHSITSFLSWFMDWISHMITQIEMRRSKEFVAFI